VVIDKLGCFFPLSDVWLAGWPLWLALSETALPELYAEKKCKLEIEVSESFRKVSESFQNFRIDPKIRNAGGTHGPP